MNKHLFGAAIVLVTLSGCATVPLESTEQSNLAKHFNPPSDGQAGLYIYRAMGPGSALKKDVWVDGKCIGETAPSIFFYEEVEGDKQYTVSTESEFSPNDMELYAKAGQNYFIKQYIKMGLFVGGANLEIVNPKQGQMDVSTLDLAKKGKCSR